MSLTAILLILGAAICHTSRDFLTKCSQDKLTFVWWIAILSTLLTAPVSIYFIMKEGVDLFWIGIALAMGLIHATYWTLYAKAYDHGDISHVYPIIRSSPAFVLIFAILFLKEQPSWIGILGISIITLGIFLLNLNTWRLRSFLEPFLAVKNEKAVQYAFLALLFVTTYTLLDKVLIAHLHPLIYIFVMTLSAIALFSLFHRKKFFEKGNLEATWKHNKKSLLAASLFAALNYPLLLFAMQMTPVSYVTGFRQISVVMMVILGGYFLKEKHSRQRLISALLIFSGALLIALA